jgi:predicted Zn-dependent peptidase
MFLLNNLLGGPALNSRLNLSIREKHGYSYHVESNYHTYVDTGVFSVYLGTDNGFLEKSLDLLNKELKRLRKNSLTGLQLDKLKLQTAGQMALGYESNLNKMLGSGKSLLHDQEVLTLKEMHERIDKVTASGILEAANVVFDPPSMSELVYKSPENGF